MENKRKIDWTSLVGTSLTILAGIGLSVWFFLVVFSEYEDDTVVKPLTLKKEVYERLVNPAAETAKTPIQNSNFGRENPFADVQ